MCQFCSEQITCAPPKVSTADSRRTMVCFSDMRDVPIASTMVTMAGSPSGMAAHRQAHCCHKHGKRWFLLQNSHAENEGADCQSPNPQLFSCLFQFLLQRRHAVRCMGKHSGNTPHFCIHARCCHQHFPFAVNHISSCKNHVFPVTCCRFFWQAPCRCFFHRQGFPC